MKHRDLIAAIVADGAILARTRGRHDIYRNPITGATQPVPRHREINEITARSILRALATPDQKDI